MFQMSVYYHFLKMLATDRVIPQIFNYLQLSQLIALEVEELILNSLVCFQERISWSRLSFYLQNWKTWWKMFESNDSIWAIWYIVPWNGFIYLRSSSGSDGSWYAITAIFIGLHIFYALAR